MERGDELVRPARREHDEAAAGVEEHQVVGIGDREVVPASARTAVVHVEEILSGSETVGDFAGQDITVELLRPESVKVGQEAVFFSNLLAYGKTVAVREVGHVDSKEFTAQSRGELKQALQSQPDRELQKRIAEAEVVVVGKVVSYKPAAGQEERPPVSEHAPEWWQAEVHVEAIEKGKPGAEALVVYVPHSDDIRWYGAPKIVVGQEGIFLLRRVSIAELKIEGFSVTSSLDVQPMERRERIRDFLQKKSQ